MKTTCRLELTAEELCAAVLEYWQKHLGLQYAHSKVVKMEHKFGELFELELEAGRVEVHE